MTTFVPRWFGITRLMSRARTLTSTQTHSFSRSKRKALIDSVSCSPFPWNASWSGFRHGGGGETKSNSITEALVLRIVAKGLRA